MAFPGGDSDLTHHDGSSSPSFPPSSSPLPVTSVSGLGDCLGSIPAVHYYQSSRTGITADQEVLPETLSESLELASDAPAGLPTELRVDCIAEPEASAQSRTIVDQRQHSSEADLGTPFEGFAALLETGPTSSSYDLAPSATAEQDGAFFSFNSFPDSGEFGEHADEQSFPTIDQGQNVSEERGSFSQFGSRLPSLQPGERTPDLDQTDNCQGGNDESNERKTHPKKGLYNVSHDDRQHMLGMISGFTSVPPCFQLPSRLSLGRYIRAYMDSFHEHLPFLHISSMSVGDCAVELLLAMAAVGAQYCFEVEKGMELFEAAKAIATERIRKWDAGIASAREGRGPRCSHVSEAFVVVRCSYTDPTQPDSNQNRQENGHGHPGLSHSGAETASMLSKEGLMQSAQALLILMAMATWSNHKEIVREALAIQSILASIARDDGLCTETQPEDAVAWEEWARNESAVRTKYVIFCFFNLQSIVYDIPPLILSSEIKMRLPCSTAEFNADTEVKWKEARAEASVPSQFQDALRRLFPRCGDVGNDDNGGDSRGWHSSLGNYVLIHALIQHIFFMRQAAQYRFSAQELTDEEIASVEHALRRWQMGWRRNPESSVDPTDPRGPVAFNSTALLRLAYVRLSIGGGAGGGPACGALGTRDPSRVAATLWGTPSLPDRRTPELVRALLHAAHALSIPVRIGIRLVARTQAFTWSVQHALCSLECALLLSKWLGSLSSSSSPSSSPSAPDGSTITDDERNILAMIRTMLDETEFAAPPLRGSTDLAETARYLNVGVLRVWATIFKGSQTWAMVDVIGSALDMYADMLEAAQ